MRLGPTELILVLAVVIILFGPTQIPKLTKMFGQSVKNFRDGMNGDSQKVETEAPKPADKSDQNDA